MELKKYLEKLQVLDIEIQAKEEHIKELRQILDALHTTVKNEIYSDLILRQLTEIKEIIADFEYKFLRDIKIKLETKRLILSVIEKVENPEYKIILELKYVNLKTWEQIAEITNYSVRNMHYIHNKALDELKRSQQQIINNLEKEYNIK